jgi:hypothetical protein
MTVWRILTHYFALSKQIRKRNTKSDSSYQLIVIGKYLWLAFSWLLAIAFILFTRYTDETDDFFKSFDLSEQEFVFRLILFSLASLFVYHFVPTIRKQIILINKHHPNTTLERYAINFSANNLKISIINILGIWFIFYIGNRDFFSTLMFAHAVLQLFTASVIIFNIKELFLWNVPKTIFILIADFLLIGLLTFMDLKPIENMILYEGLILSSSIFLSLMTEQIKIEKSALGALRTNHNMNLATIVLPLRNKSTLGIMKFVWAFLVLPLLSYNYLGLDIFKKVMFFSMMVPLTLMTSYGNNVFGFAKRLSVNFFYRPLDNKSLFKTYLKLMLIPHATCFCISLIFFIAYSSNFWEDIIGYSCISVLLLCTGFLLSLRYPITISDSATWFDNKQQSKQSLLISSGMAVGWLILISVSFKFAIFSFLVSVIAIVFIYFNRNSINKSVELFKEKLFVFLKA